MIIDQDVVDIIGLLAWLIIEQDKRNTPWYDNILEEAENTLDGINPGIMNAARQDLQRRYDEQERGG